MVARRHKHPLNLPARNEKYSKKEKKKEEKQVAVAELVQRPPELSAQLGTVRHILRMLEY